MSRFLLQQAAQICRMGGIIAYPTEAVYGLGCDPLNESAVNRILQLKQRPVEKGLILISDSLEKLLPYIAVSDEQINTLLQPQPQATTWLVPISELTPFWICGEYDTVAIRLTQHRLAKELCSHLPFPLVSTSANPASKPPARNALQVRNYFADEIDVILCGTVNLEARPSVIKDIATGKILRG
jgi:L-threonylcarbamoyladenylate synthase